MMIANDLGFTGTMRKFPQQNGMFSYTGVGFFYDRQITVVRHHDFLIVFKRHLMIGPISALFGNNNKKQTKIKPKLLLPGLSLSRQSPALVFLARAVLCHLHQTGPLFQVVFIGF